MVVQSARLVCLVHVHAANCLLPLISTHPSPKAGILAPVFRVTDHSCEKRIHTVINITACVHKQQTNYLCHLSSQPLRLFVWAGLMIVPRRMTRACVGTGDETMQPLPTNNAWTLLAVDIIKCGARPNNLQQKQKHTTTTKPATNS